MQTKVRIISKKVMIFALAAIVLVGTCSIFSPINVKAVQTTVIEVDPFSELGDISPEIYGVNHRYFNHGVGMWNPNTGDAYPDFNTTYDSIGFKSLRYPGGTVGNTFDWKRSIGPVSQRGRVVHSHISNLSPQDTDFGLDEAARYCEQHNTEMVYVYNMGNGNAQDAADLVEYLNAPNDGSNPNGGTDWAAVRAANGHTAPYNIKSFEIGNEMYIPGQYYWLAGTSWDSYQRKYALGATVHFSSQAVGLYDDWRESASISDGTVNQVKYAKYPPVNAGTETVYVGGVAWTRVNDLSQYGNENVYEIDNTTGKITFGDGIHGKIPPSLLRITITYTSTHDGYVDYYSAMKAVDSTIKVYSCYSDSTFLDIMGATYDYDGVALHPYSQTVPSRASIQEYHDKVMVMADEKSAELKEMKNKIRSKVSSQKASEIEVIASEYGILSNNAPVQHYLSSLDHGLYVAKSLMSFIELDMPQAQKHCLIDYTSGDELGPGEQAVIGENPHFIETATARVFKMFTQMFGSKRITSAVINNPTRTIYSGEVLEKLKVVSSKDNNQNVYIMVANVDRESNVTATINISNYAANGNAVISILNAPDYTSYNTVNAPDTVSITNTSIVASESFDYTFPAHSLTAIKISGNVQTPATTPLPSPLGYWKFDETSGTTAADSSGNGKDGIVKNGAIWMANGKSNGALQFDGINDKVSLPYILDPITTDLTASAWVKLSSAYDDNQIILQQGGQYGRTWLYRTPTGNLATFLGGKETIAYGTIPTNTWVHVAVVKKGTTVQLYINGKLDTCNTINITNSSIANMIVACHKTPTLTEEEWNGTIDEVRIYNQALNYNEILTLYNEFAAQ